MLFRPLDYDRPGQLVTVSEAILQLSNLYPKLPVNSMHFLEWQARCRSFSDLALLRDLTLNLTGQDGPPERLGAKGSLPISCRCWV